MTFFVNVLLCPSCKLRLPLGVEWVEKWEKYVHVAFACRHISIFVGTHFAQFSPQFYQAVKHIFRAVCCYQYCKDKILVFLG